MRRAAYEKYTAFFESIQDELDEIYDELVKNRTQQAQMLGYSNFVPLGYDRMMRNSYGAEEVKSFREQIKRDFVPFAERLHEERRTRLGVEKLSYIDEGVYYPEGNPGSGAFTGGDPEGRTDNVPGYVEGDAGIF